VSGYTGQTPDTEPPTDWRKFATCRNVDGDLFFPTPGDFRGINAAKAICAHCPVRLSCLHEALIEEDGRAKDNRFGVRGGKGPSQRYAMYSAGRNRQRAVAS